MKTLLCGFIVFGLVAIGGCRKSDRQREMEKAAQEIEKQAEHLEEQAEKLEESAESMEEAMKEMEEAMSGGDKVEPVSFRVLKAMLPEDLPGMERTDASGEKTSAFGVKVSEAQAQYLSEEGGKIEIKITDMGSVKGVVGMARFGWAMAEFERESDRGYEKTTTFDGHKALEKYTYDTERGEIQILVAERFIVDVRGRGVEMEAILSAARTIDLDELASMKSEGVTS